MNDNDPGNTLAQTFAWLAEMLLYWLNKVPLLNYIKFLQLIGIELRATEPALAELTSPTMPGRGAPSVVLVPERTQVSADPWDGGPPLIFETVRALTALRAVLDGVSTLDGGNYVDLTAFNDEAVQGFQPFGPLARDGAEFALGFSDADPLPDTERDLAVAGLPDTMSSQHRHVASVQRLHSRRPSCAG